MGTFVPLFRTDGADRLSYHLCSLNNRHWAGRSSLERQVGQHRVSAEAISIVWLWRPHLHWMEWPMPTIISRTESLCYVPLWLNPSHLHEPLLVKPWPGREPSPLSHSRTYPKAGAVCFPVTRNMHNNAFNHSSTLMTIVVKTCQYRNLGYKICIVTKCSILNVQISADSDDRDVKLIIKNQGIFLFQEDEKHCEWQYSIFINGRYLQPVHTQRA